MAVNTSATSQNHNGTGSEANFSISFPFLLNSEIEVTVDGVLKTLGTHYNIVGSQVQFTSGNIPSSGTGNIVLNRNTNISTKRVDFEDGSVLTETDLDNNANQLLFSMQEIVGSGLSTVSSVTGTTPILSSGGTTPVISITAATTSAAGSMSASDKTKLDGIEASATADQTAAEIRTLVESASDSNVFTDADHTKLNGIEASATADQTAAEIRTLVESASDSNVFTDADHTKLNGIEANATADQTNAEIKTAYEANSDTNAFTDADHNKLDGIEANADVTDATNVNAAGAVMNSDLDVKGELLVGDGSGDPSALSVGANGYVLKANSSTATGLEWAAESGGTDLSSGGTINGDLTLTGANYNVVWDKSDNALEFADLAKATFGNSKQLEIYHQTANNHSIIKETGSGSLIIQAENFDVQDTSGNSIINGVHDSYVSLAHHGDTRLITSSTGITVYSGASGSETATGAITSGNIGVTGNITVSGTVDGRDVAADGTKLDGIESGATADQTAAEIRTLVESATDSNVFTDADHTKLNAIEANADVTDATNVDAAGAVMNSDLDGKGELLVGDGSGDPTALAAGTNGYVLKANSSTATGLEWAAAGAGGDVNQNAFSNVAVSGQTTVAADSATDTLNIAAGSNVTITTNATSDTVTISSTDTNTTYSVGDGGLTQNNFTDALKNKLDGIEASATADQTDAEIRAAVEAATDSNVFTDADHTKLNGIETSADVTDATNVAAAGALMDSDFTSNGFLKRTGAGSYTVDTNTYLTSVPSSYLQNLSEDTTPQLGGDLDVQNYTILSNTTNASVNLKANGSGVVVIQAPSTSYDATLQLNCSQNSHGVKIKSPPHSAGATYTLTLPNDTGSANQVLKTDGSGGLSWVDQTAAYTNSSVDSHLNTSSASSGQILSWNGSDYAWVADQTGSGGGGSSTLTIQDEGSALSTAATTLNFVGAGVVASGTGATKTITISGTSTSLDFVEIMMFT